MMADDQDVPRVDEPRTKSDDDVTEEAAAPNPAESTEKTTGNIRDYMGRGLSPSMEAAAVALAAGMTVDEAAKKSHRAAVTVKLWLQQKPAFKQRITELRQILTDRTLGLLAAASADAVQTLVELLTDESGALRKGSADSLLSHSIKYQEVAEMKGQLAALLAQAGPRRSRGEEGGQSEDTHQGNSGTSQEAPPARAGSQPVGCHLWGRPDADPLRPVGPTA